MLLLTLITYIKCEVKCEIYAKNDNYMDISSNMRDYNLRDTNCN